MDRRLNDLLEELERFGLDNDERASDREDKLLNITRDTGVLLSLLIQAMRARRIVEIGTSNGYSTLWLAEAARATGAMVTTVEHSEAKARMAAANLERAGLSPWVSLQVCEAGQYLADLADSSVDFLFLDAERLEYPGFWPDLQRILVPNGLMVVDNAISHAAEIEPFRALVKSTPGYLTSLVPVGKGEWLVLKLAPGRA